MGFVQIDPIACAEVLELFLSKTVSTLLINEIGRNTRKDEKLRLAVEDVMSTALASGAPVYQAHRIHGRTFFSQIKQGERQHVLPRMIQEIWSGPDGREWLCFDRGELLQAMPPLQQEYPEPSIAEDPYFRFIRNLDDLDYRILFPENTKPSDKEGDKEAEGNTGETHRIADLEGQLAALKAELELARQEKAVLQAELEKARHGQEISALEDHGLCGRVIMLRREGKTEEEIAAILSKSGKWCSIPQIGALLHPGGHASRDAMIKHAQRLLGKA